MKLTSLSIVAVLVLSCTAAFGQTTVKLGFLSHDQQTQYCDYVQITVEKTSIVSGVHYIAATGSESCFNEPGYNGVMAGIVTNIPLTSGPVVTGTVTTFADDTYQQQGGLYGYMRLLRVLCNQIKTVHCAGNKGWRIWLGPLYQLWRRNDPPELRIHHQAVRQRQREFSRYL